MTNSRQRRLVTHIAAALGTLVLVAAARLVFDWPSGVVILSAVAYGAIYAAVMISPRFRRAR